MSQTVTSHGHMIMYYKEHYRRFWNRKYHTVYFIYINFKKNI